MESSVLGAWHEKASPKMRSRSIASARLGFIHVRRQRTDLSGSPRAADMDPWGPEDPHGVRNRHPSIR
eukprot:293990-Pyramimonas_sp.AAC.1